MGSSPAAMTPSSDSHGERAVYPVCRLTSHFPMERSRTWGHAESWSPGPGSGSGDVPAVQANGDPQQSGPSGCSFFLWSWGAGRRGCSPRELKRGRARGSSSKPYSPERKARHGESILPASVRPDNLALSAWLLFLPQNQRNHFPAPSLPSAL